MFAYCLNNPVFCMDEQGNSATIAGAILGGLWGLVTALTNDESDKENTFADVLSCVAIGAATGAAAGFAADLTVATCGVGTAFLGSAISSGFFAGINSAATQQILDDKVNLGKVAFDVTVGALMGGTCTAMNDFLLKPAANTLKAAVTHVNALVSTELIMFTSQGYIGSNLAFDIGATAVTSLGAWVGSAAYDFYHNLLN